ncbi:hypothetical protein QTO34_002129 [Cnephaeus nilssonii]|uniref:Uncharacterized protein n=1 Tax=Cnephaeus nilssonii TaxID=3371016 RepID=A0AA40LLJ6_CNENI|nr:hypothetical protein QTO34_002129 [Eptesicus nilssonii]
MYLGCGHIPSRGWRCPQPQDGSAQSPRPRRGGRRVEQPGGWPGCSTCLPPESHSPLSPPDAQGQPKMQASLQWQLPSHPGPARGTGKPQMVASQMPRATRGSDRRGSRMKDHLEAVIMSKSESPKEPEQLQKLFIGGLSFETTDESRGAILSHGDRSRTVW